jgi:HAD superfamily hydrolase (TIGR01509 family)
MEVPSMSRDNIRALIFDMGGVLYDTPRETNVMTRFILERLGISVSSTFSDEQIVEAIDLVDAVFDRGLVETNADPHWLPSFEDSVEYDRLILKSLGVKGDLSSLASEGHRKWADAYPRKKPKFMEPCRQVLESLRSRGFKMGIASNRRNDPVPHLTSDRVLSLFDVIEYSCVPGYRKPSPFMLLQTALKLGINPRRCAYIGDKVNPDVEAAMRAEFLPILLVWRSSEEAERAPNGTIVIQHIDELLDLFQNSGVS